MLTRIFIWIFKRNGWNLETQLPQAIDRCVLVGAPHTSNWDLVYGIAALRLLKLDIRFTIKNEWNFFPINFFLNRLGALWIERNSKKENSGKQSMTEMMTTLFTKHDKLILLVTPEGTRKKMIKWRTGFYHVALNAKVPMALGYLDYKKKSAGITKMIFPTGDKEKDLKEIMRFYQTINPKFPKKFSVDLEYVEDHLVEKRND